MGFREKAFLAIKLGVHWKTLMPYAHLKVPIEINVYRLAGSCQALFWESYLSA